MVHNVKKIISPKTKLFAVKKVLTVTLMNLLMVISFTSVSYAEWSYGIGTGFFGLNIDGTVGVTTTLAGAVEAEVDLDAGDTMDLMESAFGLGGYATDGTWKIKYAIGKLELEGSKSTSLPAIASTVSATVNFEATVAEVIVGYAVIRTPSLIVSLDGGVRYIGHDVSSQLVITGGVTESVTRNVDESWTDGLIGGTVTVPFTKELIWDTSVNAGYGGSEGTYFAQSGLTWIFHEHWSGTVYGRYTAVEYENGSKGDTDWYLYDADEFGAGLSILYHF